MGDVSLQMIRRWICPSLPDVAASRAGHLFESEDAIELVAQVALDSGHPLPHS